MTSDINTILTVVLLQNNKIRALSGGIFVNTYKYVIPSHINTIEFVDEPVIILDVFNIFTVILDYNDFISKIEPTVKTLIYDKLSNYYKNENLYNNLPVHIEHIITNICEEEKNIFPKLSNLPINLKTLSIINLKCEYSKKNKKFKIICDTSNVLKTPDEYILNHELKLPYGCILKCGNKTYDSVEYFCFKLEFDHVQKSIYDTNYLEYKKKYIFTP